MIATGAHSVGRFSVEFEVANLDDIVRARHGSLQFDQVRRSTIAGIVDCGATRLVLPEQVVNQLGLQRAGKVQVRYADGRTAERDTVEGVYVQLLGRRGTFTASVEPNRTTALIGAIVLEDLDFLVDSTNQRLVPRDPNIIVTEIE
jgi:predicted aspartyl protease